MEQAFSPPAPYRYRPSPRGRLPAALMSLGVLALIVLMILRLGALSGASGGARTKLVAMNFRPSAEPARDRTKARAVKASDRARVVRQPQARPRPSPSPPALKLIPLSKAELAASDISRLPRDAAQTDDSGQSEASQYGPGEGPNGARLYSADWYREPSDAELAGYLPARVPPGSWATIACRMVEHYHVDRLPGTGQIAARFGPLTGIASCLFGNSSCARRELAVVRSLAPGYESGSTSHVARKDDQARPHSFNPGVANTFDMAPIVNPAFRRSGLP